jgi:hypothetical protein
VQSAKLGNDERLAALKRLDEQARRLEQHAAGPSSTRSWKENEARLPDMAVEVFSAGKRQRVPHAPDDGTSWYASAFLRTSTKSPGGSTGSGQGGSRQSGRR